MSETLIKVENVSKKFCRDLKRSLYYGLTDMGREMMGMDTSGMDSLRKKEFWAVDDVSFELKRGECLGLIGHNGAGKSTLLKLLNGLIKPDKGRIEMHGRVGALIELGAGFNPILTGRENIYVNGAVLGLTRREIDAMLDEIIEFSEIADFIDTPVQYYSSGMKVRLGFSIATQMKPDIMLIDEVLAVGDIAFVLKCFNKMDSLMQNSAIILVSHNIPQIARMCNSLILMKEGKVLYSSPDVSDGISLYYSMLSKPEGNFIGSDSASLEEIILSSNARTSRPGEDFFVNYGEELTVRIKIKVQDHIEKPSIYLAFYDKEQRNFGEVMNFDNSARFIKTLDGAFHFEAHFSKIEFSQGLFSITVGMSNLDNGVRKSLFRKQSAIYFLVKGEHHGWAPMQFKPGWKSLPS